MNCAAHRAVWVLMAALAMPALSPSQPSQSGAAAIQLALERLTVSGSALMIAAHPDDENTALLAHLAMGRKVRTGYLSLTRGEGGQNLIGPEQGALLGVIRTQELLAARRVDGAEQFFTRAVDFGYSKSAGEAMRIWDRERVLGDIVLVIRKFRPDVIILRFSGTSRDGHGQHQASAILGKEAFFAAADPARYPEQLREVQPWKARRLVWNAFSFNRQQEKETEALPNKLEIDVGRFDPLLGRSYAEIAGISRSMHQSQAMGSPQRRGPQKDFLMHVAGDPATKDLFEGTQYQDASPAGEVLREAARTFDWRIPERTVPLLIKARAQVTDLRKRRDLDEAIGLCAGLWLDASANRPLVSAGETIQVRAQALNRSELPVTLHGVTLEGEPASAAAIVEKPLTYNLVAQQVLEWRAKPNSRKPSVEQPEPDPVLIARFRLAVAGEEMEFARPVIYRYVDDLHGELTRPLAIVPPVSVRFGAPSTLFPSKGQRTVDLKVHAFTNASGNARLALPPEWKSEPASAPFALSHPGEEMVVHFRVTPPASAAIADAGAIAAVPGAESNVDVEVLNYSHIPVQVVNTKAKSKVTRSDVVSLAKRIGYIMGAGDLVPDALRQLDCEVTLLSPIDLSAGDLSRFEAIVTGVRAYNTRDDLRANQHRLMEYVRGGGTLIVQYNVLGSELSQQSIGPYPIKIGRERVAEEEAPVNLLKPDHVLLQSPNRVTQSDFEGWVQERGLYFASGWDPRYEALIQSADAGEQPHAGGLLYARVGKGVYIFTAYSWFRQLPAGVPGAYRLFANLLSAGKVLATKE
jgi:LmbE family N-acetylglucosaminyl deacetylase